LSANHFGFESHSVSSMSTTDMFEESILLGP
jgi:hypothetical protein